MRQKTASSRLECNYFIQNYQRVGLSRLLHKIFIQQDHNFVMSFLSIIKYQTFLVTKLPGIHRSLSSMMKKRLFTFSLPVSNLCLPQSPFLRWIIWVYNIWLLMNIQDKIFHAASNMQGSRYILPPITTKEISQHSLLLLQNLLPSKKFQINHLHSLTSPEPQSQVKFKRAVLQNPKTKILCKST